MPEDFYYTDAINDEACQMIEDACDNGNNNPFFLYVAHTAPHWPLHAPQGRTVCLFIK
jgi:arylsulfatase